MYLHAVTVVILLQGAYCKTSITVGTKLGDIVGNENEITFAGKTFAVRTYLGIPYAEAPVGDLRFKRPVPKGPFSLPYNATYPRALCPQGGDSLLSLEGNTVSEDCLKLNIYAPGRPEVTKGHNLAVMIYIHSGAFVVGGANFYAADVLSAYGDVIVVTINYRLSIYGFLSTGDDICPGNNGLWDQQLAIQWVHSNIASFGGDPTRITLFGQSSGSTSCLYQATFPGNKGLFEGIITGSGSPLGLSDYKFTPETESNAQAIGRSLGCRDMSSAGILACLRGKTVNDIAPYLTSTFLPVHFSPVVDGEFIRADTNVVLNRANEDFADVQEMFLTVSILLGANDMEGAMYMLYLWPPILLIFDPEHFTMSKARYEKTVLPMMVDEMFGTEVPDVVLEAVSARYTDLVAHPDDADTFRDLFLRLYTDYLSTIPILRTSLKHWDLSETANTYLYEFVARSSLTLGPLEPPSWVTGACQGDEIPYIFGFSSNFLQAMNVSETFRPTEQDLRLSRSIITFWSNFAKSGDPNKPVKMENIPEWPSYENTTSAFYQLSFNLAESVKYDFGEPTASFWLQLLPTILDSVSDSKSSPRKTCQSDVTIDYHPSTTVLVITIIGIMLLATVSGLVITCLRFRCIMKSRLSYGAVELVL